MDGYEATKEIREKERKTGEHIPIIAMTAHALKGDREECIAAGMDDYISKPINATSLYETVEKSSKIQKEQEPPFQIDDLEKHLGGDRDLLKELLQMFLTSSFEDLAQLTEAIDEGDGQRAANIAHGLKGELGNLRFSEASDLAAEIERKTKEESFQEAEEVLQELEKKIDEIREYYPKL